MEVVSNQRDQAERPAGELPNSYVPPPPGNRFTRGVMLLLIVIIVAAIFGSARVLLLR